MNTSEVLQIAREIAGQQDLLKHFYVHTANHDDYFKEGIKKGIYIPQNAVLVAINDSPTQLGFGVRPGSYIEFMTDFDLKIAKDVSIQTRDALKGKGYARKLINLMEQTSKQLRLNLIKVGNSHNPSFWKHMNYQRFVDSEDNGEIYLIKNFN